MRALAALLILVSLAAAGDTKPLWVAVGPPAYRKAVAPLAEHRRADGFEVALLGPDETPARAPDYLLLLGDVDVLAPWQAPLYRWRRVQPKTFASDADRADRDGDRLPDFPVGRVPARTVDDIATFVKKTIAYERSAPTVADLRIVAWAGAPGYGGMVDTMATQMIVNTVRQYAPPWTSPWLISADANSALCGWPPDQPRAFVAALREGALLGAVLAHGNADATFSMRHGGNGIWFSIPEARARLGEGPPTAPLVLLACNCGHFDRDRQSLAEVLLFLPGGPVATVAASAESHPLTNFYTGVGMLKTLADPPAPRFGAVWLAAQRAGAAESSMLIESMLKDVEGKLEAEIDVAKLRRDQQRIYAFFGDPALRMPLPGKLEASVEKTSAGWHWSVPAVEGATSLHVGFRRSPPRMVAPAAPDDADARRAKFAEANAAEAYAAQAKLEGAGPWEGTATEPGRLRLVAVGPAGLRVVVLDLH